MYNEMDTQVNAIKAKYQTQLEEQKDKLYDLYKTHLYSHNYLLPQVKKYIKGQFKHIESIQYTLPRQSKGKVMYGNVKVFFGGGSCHNRFTNIVEIKTTSKDKEYNVYRDISSESTIQFVGTLNFVELFELICSINNEVDIQQISSNEVKTQQL